MARPFVQRYTTRAGGTRYRAWYYDAVDRKVGKVFHTKREAEAFLREREAEAATGTLTDTRAGRITLRAVWDERRARETFAANTIATQDNVWRIAGPALGNRPIADIRSAQIDAVVSRFNGPAAQAKARSILVAVFNYAIATRRIAVNPAKAGRRSRTRSARMAAQSAISAKDARRLTADELHALVDAVPDRNRMMVELMARVGLRPGETLALTVEQFDHEARTLRIDRTASAERFTKTGKPRTVLVPRIIADRLAGHIRKFATNGLVFPDRDGSEYTVSGFRSIFQRAGVKVGVNHGYSPNDLRHTAAGFAIAHGANVYDVQRMLGHAKPSITLDVYGFLWDGSGERLADVLDEAIRKEQK